MAIDFKKIKDIAKTAVDKTAEGISKANEIRKKASLETKITLPARNQFSSPTIVRKTVDGQYYIGMYVEEPVLYEFENFSFSGSTIIERTTTTGKTKQKGKKASTLAGAALGTVLAPGIGTVVGGMVGASGKKKGTINSTSVTTQEEKPGSASISLRNIATGEIKTISTKLTQVQANNVERFFE
ncbi:phage protein [Streptococcus gordonii]|nr:hypothetical protein [Streptococcus gordonii]VTT05367.1 phage protein [Streptococcus gordonii]